MNSTLIIRYNRLGDAVISLPVICGIASNNLETTFIVVSNNKFSELFELMPSNVIFIPMVSKKSKGFFRGISFIIRKEVFYRKLLWSIIPKVSKIAILQKESFERRLLKNKALKNKIVADLPELLFSLDKLESKKLPGLSKIIDSYKHSFINLGYDNFETSFDSSILKKMDISRLYENLNLKGSKKTIVIAPFSYQRSKRYPLDKMEEIISYLNSKQNSYNIFIFGAGTNEQSIAEEWESKYNRVFSVIGKLSFYEEMLVMGQSEVVVSMDSSNLHLAYLLDVPVVSIWGGTVPECGYYPEKLSLEFAVVKYIACQPCSIWGSGSCIHSKNFECLNIEPSIIISKINNVISVH